MSQTWNVPQNAQSAKAVDYAFVIAGSPTIYTVVKNTYALGGDLSTTKGFAPPDPAVPSITSYNWLDIPDSVGAGAKGRPEEGSCTIGQIDVSILDRMIAGKRAMSDLLSRQAYLEGTSAGEITELTDNIDGSSSSIPVGSTAGFKSTNGTIYIGLESIDYATVTGKSFEGCTRGRRLTNATAHYVDLEFGLAPPKVYSFMPSLYGRRAFLYKGYQSLNFDQWVPAFGGVIGGATKKGPSAVFSVFDTTWLTYANGNQVLLGAPKQPGVPGVFRSASITNDLHPGDYTDIRIEIDDVTNLGDGHYLINLAGNWSAIKSVS